jgi:copper chaperone CopZ
MSHTQLIVQGMNCEACRQAVEGALTLPGVSSVAVDLGTGGVDVTHAQDITPELMVGAVEDSGYTVSEVRAE